MRNPFISQMTRTVQICNKSRQAFIQCLNKSNGSVFLSVVLLFGQWWLLHWLKKEDRHFHSYDNKRLLIKMEFCYFACSCTVFCSFRKHFGSFHFLLLIHFISMKWFHFYDGKYGKWFRHNDAIINVEWQLL